MCAKLCLGGEHSKRPCWRARLGFKTVNGLGRTCERKIKVVKKIVRLSNRYLFRRLNLFGGMRGF